MKAKKFSIKARPAFSFHFNRLGLAMVVVFIVAALVARLLGFI